MGRTEYTNPVHEGSFPDPFVMQVDGVYYAFGTDMVPGARRVIGLCRSDDLVSWEPMEPALERPASIPR